MKEAVVIHPRLTVYGGGEMIALHTIKALQELGYQVSIVTDNYNPSEIEQNYHLGEVMENCKPITIPGFRPVASRFLALQKLRYSGMVMDILRTLKPDVAFSTQSVIYSVPRMRTYHIVYDMADFFEIVPGGRSPLAAVWKKPYYALLRRVIGTDFKSNRVFVPLSYSLEKQLKVLGYPHSPVVFPPCDLIFRARPKKDQVCLVSRIAPQKNIGDFMKIASKVPKHKFILVGALSGEPSYERRVLSTKPENVEYFEVRIRERPDLLEESKVYLYTSLEPGIGIALGQAMGAGCIPITPAWGGGSEMVSVSGVGYTYRTLDEAARLIQTTLESSGNARDQASFVSEKSKIFSSETFENHIRGLLSSSEKMIARSP